MSSAHAGRDPVICNRCRMILGERSRHGAQVIENIGGRDIGEPQGYYTLICRIYRLESSDAEAFVRSFVVSVQG